MTDKSIRYIIKYRIIKNNLDLFIKYDNYRKKYITNINKISHLKFKEKTKNICDIISKIARSKLEYSNKAYNRDIVWSLYGFYLKLKQNNLVMKNIENKTIKELIPLGFEIDLGKPIEIHDNIIIPIKKKEKSFVDYIIRYKRENILQGNDPIYWKIEFKLGLLRHICNDLGYNFEKFTLIMIDINNNNYDSENSEYIINKILSITGEDFLQSIKDNF